MMIDASNAAKVCSSCHEELPLADFAIARRAKDGRQRWCRPCSALNRKAWSARQRGNSSQLIADATSAAGLNEIGAGQTIAQMKLDHELRDIDADRIAALLSLARAVDVDPGNAALWSQYRGAMREIRLIRPEDKAATKLASSAALLKKIRGGKPHPLSSRPTPEAERAERRPGEVADLSVLDPDAPL
jgi:hypothetical protein